MTRIAIVGAGITGLAMAHHLTSDPQRGDVRVTLIDAQSRVGGKLRIEPFADHTVDVGADAFLARKPHTERLVRAVGLGEDLVEPATSKVYLWLDGVLRPLPEGTVLGVPTELGPLLRSGAVSFGSAVRAGLDLVMPREPRLTDRAVGDLVAERFGQEIVDVLVDPLLGGVYAGDPAQLSVRATSPLLFEAARESRSLLRGLRRARAGAATDGPVFYTLDGGLGRLVDRLREVVEPRVDLHTAQPVRLIERRDDGHYHLVLSKGEPVDADVVVLAVPAYVAAALLRDLAPQASSTLRDIEYASVATVSVAYDRGAVGHPLDASGLLVPSREGRTIKAATFVSSKWPHQHDPDRVLIRASVGRVGDDVLARTDEELRTAVHRDLREALDLTAAPVSSMVTRWERALPQYTVGHLDRVERARSSLDELSGLHLAGAAYDGIGVASCTERAEELATQLLG